MRDGQKAADLYIRSDALVGVEAILAGLDKTLGAGKPTAAAIRSKELAHRIATEPADSMAFDIEPGVLDPREAIRAIDAVIPKDWDIVVGGGHQAYFNTQMRGRPAERYTTVREFGAVGNGPSYALELRLRAGRAQGKVVLFEGDGVFVPYPGTRDDQASRTSHPDLRDERRRIRPEFHKLRADGIDDSLRVRPACVREDRCGFDLRATRLRCVGIPKLLPTRRARRQRNMEHSDSDKVLAPMIRQTIKRGHGNM